ncbi:hypothetical protein [Streptomyces sp. ISL-100]|uniref:hypothetical protein n=1 Tax=Streptomyces sp. ISL-100 TaxID=2819173 RepID=UPI0020360889|nr:hypothetical protein [Streptomyces sp. ISL-100]
MAGPELLDSIALTGRADLPDSDRRLFERASLVTALLLLLRRTVPEAEDRVRGELLDDLLAEDQPDNPRNISSLTLRARKLGIQLGNPHEVLVLHCDGPLRQRLMDETARRARASGGLAGLYKGHVISSLRPATPGSSRANSPRISAGRSAPPSRSDPLDPPSCPAPTPMPWCASGHSAI